MLTANLVEFKKRFFYFITLLLIFYVFTPYILWFYDGYFLKSVLSSFPVSDPNQAEYYEEIKNQKYILSVFESININCYDFTKESKFKGICLYSSIYEIYRR